jgi:hypothetical protein
VVLFRRKGVLSEPLSWCYAREKNFHAALDVIAEALALDKTGEYRDRLMHKLQEIMQQLGQRHQQEYLLLINLVSRYAKKDDGEKGKPGEWLDGSATATTAIR